MRARTPGKFHLLIKVLRSWKPQDRVPRIDFDRFLKSVQWPRPGAAATADKAAPEARDT